MGKRNIVERYAKKLINRVLVDKTINLNHIIILFKNG